MSLATVSIIRGPNANDQLDCTCLPSEIAFLWQLALAYAQTCPRTEIRFSAYLFNAPIDPRSSSRPLALKNGIGLVIKPATSDFLEPVDNRVHVIPHPLCQKNNAV